MRGLKGKAVLVTGGASGIGRATAVRFLEEGSRVAIIDHDVKRCAALERELPELDVVEACDVTDEARLPDAVQSIAETLGGLDVLINNAGISIRHEGFLNVPREGWNRVIDVNLTGAFFTAQAAAREMVKQGRGVILNMASTNGLVGYKHYFDYNASKAGLLELTRSMALEFAPDIRVNAVAPGYILTPMQRAEYTDEMLAALDKKIPLGRHGAPEEVAALFAFLASDEAAYITGQAFVIDGGETAGGLASL